MNEKEALVSLCAFVPFGPARIKLLREYFGGARKVWGASAKQLEEIGLSDKLISEFIAFRDKFDVKSYFIRIEKLGVKIIINDDKNYPERLKNIDYPPTLIYVKGEILPRDQISIAIVGSRKITSYGRQVTEKIAGELASSGVTIVSGLAIGVDGVAHRSALDVGGRTIAVVGSGIDNIYPPSHKNLAQDIANSGCIISEYPLSYPALPVNFPHRNRIISGLSLGVVVIEGTQKSGTLLTAAHAAAQGREVFAVPGPITSPNSSAPHILIKQGAKLVTGVSDILEELDIKTRAKTADLPSLPQTFEEKAILNLLEHGPLHIDQILRSVEFDLGKVMATLTTMELRGIVKNVGGIYTKR